ncbi:hypothetical protein [Microbacterium sp.]|uniref:hypothetical protein n=1 Tax=Microbacterium sp. TaxID=51671 RepID=UPI002810D065|nr:hypothetical protein [Microbacterium sp.]
MSATGQDRYVLRQVSPDDWVIMDHVFSSDGAHHLVGCVTEYEGHVEVRWFRQLSLPTRFAAREDALQAFVAATAPALAAV